MLPVKSGNGFAGAMIIFHHQPVPAVHIQINNIGLDCRCIVPLVKRQYTVNIKTNPVLNFGGEAIGAVFKRE